MTLSQSRPVPDAISREQKRFEVELLLQQPVLAPNDLAKADRELIQAEGPGSPQQWMAWGAMPLSNLNGLLRLAVPTHWGAEQRQHLLQALQLRGDQASYGLALADDLAEALGPFKTLVKLRRSPGHSLAPIPTESWLHPLRAPGSRAWPYPWPMPP